MVLAIIAQIYKLIYSDGKKSDEADGLRSLLAFLFNAGCWVILGIVTTPWNLIWLCLFFAGCEKERLKRPKKEELESEGRCRKV